ncbi:50S ribosomal protein L5 [Candidatus Shapirobacteria bacterium]|nr:50S ribosomal protein L5 [Candidatus Shapirobacteria bacterium]
MLKRDWEKEIKPSLQKKLGITNPMMVPRVERVVVHMGVAAEKDDQALIDELVEQMGLITGQKPKICTAKKAVAGFKLRPGETVGLKVTLRRKRMYDFLEILFKLVMPRLRDFRGLPETKFDSQANYSLGLPEQTVFPALPVERIKRIKGVEVTLVTSTKNKLWAKELLLAMGLPLAKKG